MSTGRLLTSPHDLTHAGGGSVLDLAGIPKAQWPDGLDGYSLKPLMAVAGDDEVVDDRPDFIVSDRISRTVPQSQTPRT